MHKKQIGARFIDDKRVHFSIWAPNAKTLELKIGDHFYEMQKDEAGYYSYTLENAQGEIDYLYRIDGKTLRPDPASSFQPYGVHKESRVCRFEKEADAFSGPPLSDYIIYELHVGLFTKEGTFDALIETLDHFVELGITAIELMPVTAFPGSRNWGYDQVYPFAVCASYGGPEGLKRFVSACHSKNIAVILDVIYNHLGPEGNYMADFGPYFTDRYKTPWGSALNFDGAGSDHVREFFIQNALFWQEEFQIDALRLDAVHAIYDMGVKHILQELSERVTIPLIAESDLNDTKIISDEAFGIDAQWSDDFHHTLFTYLTKSNWGYFVDFGSLEMVAKAIKNGFVYDGIYSNYRKKTFGSDSSELTAKKFVVSLETHDQVANASKGKRFFSLVSKEEATLAVMTLFMTPAIPFLFMGQEWGAETEFVYFTDFEDEVLGKLVHEGYMRENMVEGVDPESMNPQNEERFLRCKLDYTECQRGSHKEIFEFYKKIIEFRKKHLAISDTSKEETEVLFDEEKKWLSIKREGVYFLANFSDQKMAMPTGYKALFSNQEITDELKSKQGVFFI